jgi:hypothetical protein
MWFVVYGQNGLNAVHWRLDRFRTICNPGAFVMTRRQDALATFHPTLRALVPGHVRRADAGSDPGLARDLRRSSHAAAGSDRLGQDVGGVPGRHRPHHVSRACLVARDRFRNRPPKAATVCQPRRARPVHFAAEGAGRRCRAKSPFAPGRGACGCGSGWYRLSSADRRRPVRRHAVGGPVAAAALSAGDLDHDARVAVSDVDLAGSRDPAHGRYGDRRRDPFVGRDETRRSSGDLARAVGTVAAAGGFRQHRRFSASGCPPPSGRWTRWPGSWVVRKRRPIPSRRRSPAPSR